MVGGKALGGRILRLYLPLAFFLVAMLFPFYWMAITSIKPNRELYSQRIMPLIVHQPTLKHYVDLFDQTNFLTWTYNTMLVAVVTTVISLVLGVMIGVSARAHELPRRGRGGHRGGRDVPRAPAAALHPDGRHHQPARPRQHAVGGHADVPDAAHPVLRVAPDGLLQERAARAGGGGAHRRREPASRP